MVVAFVEVESRQNRMLSYALGDSEQDFVGRAHRPAVWLRRTASGDLRPTYWCAADKPPTGDDLRVRSVYRTNTVPKDASCEVCGINIRELQEKMA